MPVLNFPATVLLLIGTLTVSRVFSFHKCYFTQQEPSKLTTPPRPQHPTLGFKGLTEHLTKVLKADNKTFPDDFFPKLPASFVKLTAEGVEEFFRIIDDRSLTKAQLKTKVERWVGNMSGEAAKQFSNIEKDVNTFLKTVRIKTTEVIANVTTIIQKMIAIEDDMSITRDEEIKQMKALFQGKSHPLIYIILDAKDLAFNETVNALVSRMEKESRVANNETSLNRV